MSKQQQEILSTINKAIRKFNAGLPAAQREVFKGILDELKTLDTTNGKVKTTVANLRAITRISNKLQGLILSDKYMDDVKTYMGAFNDVTKLQNDYFKTIETRFKPGALLKELRKQTIADTVSKLTEGGVATTIQEEVKSILTTNITTGVEYADLVEQLQQKFTDTDEEYGLVSKYGRQIVTDSINQYSRQYNQTAAAGLGLEWFAYNGSDITTTRPFCDACTDIVYFHVTQIPELLRAKDLFYTDQKTGERRKVELSKKTGLPKGMYANTTPTNFLTYLGGYNCRHQASPISETLVKFQAPEIFNKVVATAAYKEWKKQNGEKVPETIPEEAEIPPVPEELKPEPPKEKVIEPKENKKTDKTKEQFDYEQYGLAVGKYHVNFKNEIKETQRQVTKEEREYRGKTDEKFNELFIDIDVSDDYTDEDLAQLTEVDDLEKITNKNLKAVVHRWLDSSGKIRGMHNQSAEKIAFMRALSVPTKHEVLYRGMKFSLYDKNSTQTKLYNYLTNNIFKVGTVFSGMDEFVFTGANGNKEYYDNSATSYTKTRKVAGRFASEGFSNEFMKSVIIKLVPSTGKTIHGLDLTKISYEDEAEVVIGNGYKYKVIEVQKTSNGDFEILIEQIV